MVYLGALADGDYRVHALDAMSVEQVWVAEAPYPFGAELTGEGSAIREAFRQFNVAVEGMAALVEAELSEKLERPISLTFGKLGAIDIAARARATGTFAGIEGIDPERALRLAGVTE